MLDKYLHSINIILADAWLDKMVQVLLFGVIPSDIRKENRATSEMCIYKTPKYSLHFFLFLYLCNNKNRIS